MKRQSVILCELLIGVLLLCGCGAVNTESDSGKTENLPAAAETVLPEAGAEPTPIPVPEYTFPDGSVHRADETVLDLSSLTHRDVETVAALLREMPDLQEIELGTDGAWTGTQPELTEETAMQERPENAARDLSWEDLRILQEAAPDAEILYRFCFYGREFTTQDEVMDLNHSTMYDEGEAVRNILPLMKHCRYLDMDSCGVSSESMAEIRDAYPDMDVVWRVWFGYGLCCRTDIELMVNSSGTGGMFDDNSQELKYCTKVKRLDMGHNRDLHDWSFLSYMKDLEICIITVGGWTDIEMLRGLSKLEYLEICPIDHEWCGELDLSPLGELTNLEHLNICGISHTRNWEVLKNLTKLKRLWIGHWTAYGFPEGAIEELKEALPNTEINTTELSAATGSWKGGDGQQGPFPERYALLREQMEYDKNWGYFPRPDEDPKYLPPWSPWAQ